MSLRHTLAIAVVAATGLAGAASAHHSSFGYSSYVLKPSIVRPIVKPGHKVYRPCPAGWVYVGHPLSPQFHCQPKTFIWGR